MRTREATGRRAPLLAALLALLLLALSAPAGASQQRAARPDDMLVAAVGHAAVLVGSAPQRLTPSPRPSVRRHVAAAALPAAVVIAFLLAARVRRRGGVGTPRPSQLLLAAGRGPPVSC